MATLAPNPEEELMSQDTMQMIEGALAKLSPRDQDLLVTRMDLGTSFVEIALELDFPSPDAARKAFDRARHRLEIILADLM
jgi:DNA-directed RNA polymerase specialized sigma24 family protein